MRRILMILGLVALLCGTVMAGSGLIRSVSLDTRGPLPLGESLNVRVDGAAGGQGRLALGGRFTPMLEVFPGVYRARYTVGVEDRQGAQPVAVYLFMPDGRFESRDLGLVSLAPQRTPAAAPAYDGGTAAWAPSPAWTVGAPRSFAVAGYSTAPQPVMVPSMMGYDTTYDPYANSGYGYSSSPYAAYNPYGYSSSPYAAYNPYGYGYSPYAAYNPYGYGYSPYAAYNPGYTSLNLTGNALAFQQVQPSNPSFLLSPFGTVMAYPRPNTLALSTNGDTLAVSGFQDGLGFSLGQGGLSLALMPRVDAFFLPGTVAPPPLVVVPTAPLLPVTTPASDPLTFTTFAPQFADFVTVSSARQVVLANWPDRDFVAVAPIRTHVPNGNAWGWWRNRTGAPTLVRVGNDRFDARRFGVAGTLVAPKVVRTGSQGFMTPRVERVPAYAPPRRERERVYAPPVQVYVPRRQERRQDVRIEAPRVQFQAPPRQQPRVQFQAPPRQERRPEIRWQQPRQDQRWQAPRVQFQAPPRQQPRTDTRWQAPPRQDRGREARLQAPPQARIEVPRVRFQAQPQLRVQAPRAQVQAQPQVRMEAPRVDNRGNGGGHGNDRGGNDRGSGGGNGHGGGHRGR